MAYDLSLREKRLIQAAGILIALFLLYLLFFRGGSAPVAPITQPDPLAAPMPAPPSVAAMPAPPPAPVADLSGLRLHGLLASGAVIGFPDGRQRLVPVGRDALPGLTLRRIEQSQAVFDSAAGEMRLGFDGPVQAVPGAAAAPAPVPTASSVGAAQREETLRYRLGLAPRRAGGRVTGFTVRSNVEMPALARAGIRPGDVITGVNGSVFDEERMQELAWQIANSTRVIFEVERGGQRLRLALPGR
jgi:general secretion pathway protein C